LELSSNSVLSIDTVKNNDRYELIKKYGLTQFDSGKYTIQYKDSDQQQTVHVDSISVEVANVQVNTLKQKMYDIKDRSSKVRLAIGGNTFDTGALILG
jgi:hypothetical protein